MLNSKNNTPSQSISDNVVEGIKQPPRLYVHHSQVPQSVVRSNPAEWYLPSSESTIKSYASKKLPTFTPNPGWTDQQYLDNRKKYQSQIDALRTQYNKALMSAKDLRYVPAPAGYGPSDPLPLNALFRPGSYPTSQVIDAQGNNVAASAYSNNGNSGNNNNNSFNKNTYRRSTDQAGDAFTYNYYNTHRGVRGFRNGTASDLRNWNYDPYKAAKHPDYATRQGNIASWDRIKGMPTVSNVYPIKDGNQYFASESVLPDYSASLDRFTHANDNNTTRLPNSSGKVTVADLEASGLLSKPQTIRYNGEKQGWDGFEPWQETEENARTARLQDLFTDRLLVPGKVDRSVEVSNRLSDAIGDARRDAILNTAASNNYNHQRFGDNLLAPIGTHTFGRAHLSGVDNLSLPITYTDDVRGEGKRMTNTGDILYTYLHLPKSPTSSPIDQADPRYKMYRNDGTIRVFTDADYSSWDPRHSRIDLANYDQYQPSKDRNLLLDKMRASSGSDKFNIGASIGSDYHHNDLPANGFQGDIRNALLHEGIHASTGYNTNIIDEETLHNKRKLYFDMLYAMDDDKNSPNIDKINKIHDAVGDDLYKLETTANQTTALGAALGVSREDPDKTSRGYASNSEAEMLRALHHAKSGYARHLIAEGKLTPEEVVDEVQNPDKFLDFMQGVYRGSFKGNNDDPTSYSFPSTMSQVGTEREMARSVAGIQPFIQTLLSERNRANMLNNRYKPHLIEDPDQIPSPKDNHIFRNQDGDPSKLQWKDNLYTPEQQLDIFRNNIWPQVRNNDSSARYQTLA